MDIKSIILQFKEKVSDLEKALQERAVISAPQKLGKITKEYNKAREILHLAEETKKIELEIDELKKSARQEKEDELRQLLEKEISKLTDKGQKVRESLYDLLHPGDPLDKKDVIMEIRAGTGGDEAALFGADLFRMYSKYAESKNWKTKIISANRIGVGGFKDIIFSISGQNVFGNLKYESGVHRVQRIPVTEKTGRIHTSTATVAVLPKAEEVDLEINPRDLRILTSTSRGHGGQSVNTTYSAIRITHLPTGMVVSCQDERSQTQNRQKALQILRSRLFALEEEKRRRKEAETRRAQIGTGERAEKIRTYNFPQDRISDHRIGQNWHNIQNVLDGNLGDIISKVKASLTLPSPHSSYEG